MYIYIYIYVFFISFCLFFITQLQKLRIFKIHFNLTSFSWYLQIMYKRKITPASPPFFFCNNCFFQTDREIQNLFYFVHLFFYTSVIIFLPNLSLKPQTGPKSREQLISLTPSCPTLHPPSIWMYCGWHQWLRVWVLRRLPGRTLAWVSCQGSAGRAPRWGPCVCTAWCR